MKKLLVIATIGMSTLVLGSEPLTVQVISAVHEKSVTKAFDAKVKETGMKVHKKVEDNRFVVTVGEFSDHKSAKKGETIARQFVTKDAFIRPVDRHSKAIAHSVTASKHEEPHSSLVVEHKGEQKAVVMATEQHKIEPKQVESKPVVSVVEVKPVEYKASEMKVALQTVSSDCDRREMHKSEISEAINYYKNSPYHRFEPVKLR